MAYPLLESIHLLALVAWIGGMFFMLACLRPALGLLDGPQRPRLMQAVMARFFAVVGAAIGAILLSGLGMLWLQHRARGTLAGLPASWHAMFGLGLVMMAVFEYLRRTLFGRLRAALAAGDGPAAAAALDRIRALVLLNLVLGVVVILAMKLGTGAGP